jgi:hypothetical protein
MYLDQIKATKSLHFITYVRANFHFFCPFSLCYVGGKADDACCRSRRTTSAPAATTFAVSLWRRPQQQQLDNWQQQRWPPQPQQRPERQRIRIFILTYILIIVAISSICRSLVPRSACSLGRPLLSLPPTAAQSP